MMRKMSALNSYGRTRGKQTMQTTINAHVFKTSNQYDVELVPLNQIHCTEAHNESRVAQLCSKIKTDNMWTNPIIIEKTTALIMDGHHRFAAAKQLGLSHVPCIKLDYDDQRVELSFWRDNLQPSVNDILALKGSGEVLPYKTTRHVFNPTIGNCRIKVDLLY